MFFGPIYIPRALNTGTCLWQVTYFILRTYTGAMCQPQPTQEISGEVLKKNAGEWNRRVEIGEKKIPGSKRSIYGYILTYSRL